MKDKKKVQVGKDQEKAQSEKDSHSKNRGGKIVCVKALHIGIPQPIKLTRVFTEDLHASPPIACTISDMRTELLV